MRELFNAMRYTTVFMERNIGKIVGDNLPKSFVTHDFQELS